MKIRDDVVIGQHSHVGMARTENQDFFGYWEPDDDREFDLKGRLAVVCDGMGGHAGGEIASRVAVQTIINEYKKDQSGNVEEALRHAIEAANAAIQREGVKEPKLMGMGSTCTALVHRRDMVYFGQVGDSRGYLVRNGKIKQMTKDHSLVQELVDQGLIDKSEMESHPDKNVILRSLGVKPTVDVDVSYVPATPNDIFLLCSDGLSGPVSEQEMLSIVQASNGDLRSASERLIELANRYGGFDNITVQLVKVVRIEAAKTDKTDAKTVTANFSPDQVQESIAKAKAEAAAKGKKPADKPSSPPPTSGGMPTPALAATSPGMPSKKTEIMEPFAGEIISSAKVPAATPPSSGGGGGKLVVGLFLGLVLGGALGFGAAKALGGAPGPTAVSSGGSVADAVKPETEAAATALAAAKDDMKRARAEELAKDLHASALKAADAALAEKDPVARITALRAAADSCSKASNAARSAIREREAQDAKAKAEAADGKAKAKSATPAYKAAMDQYQKGIKAQSENEFIGARAHFLAATALFEIASQS